jgi:hypothetical protein
MRALLSSRYEKVNSVASALCCGLIVLSLALASPALAAGGGGGGGSGGGGSGGGGEGGGGAGGGGGGSGGGGAGGGGAGGGGGGGGGSAAAHRFNTETDLTTCPPGMVWDVKHHRCLARHSGVLPDAEMTEYAFALAKAGRFEESIDTLDLLDNPNTPRALNYRGYATRMLGRTDEGINYYLQSVALDPNNPQVREYLGEAYVIEGKYDLAKDQLATIGKICGSSCEYNEELSDSLTKAHAL